MPDPATHTADVLILGAGAAGLMAAFTAGRRGRRVVVLDPGERPGRKILISGGGRCNFTNLGTRAESFLSENPHFARSALARYTPQNFLDLVNRHGIRWHEKNLGQLFCDTSAKQIVTLLERECGEAGVTLRCGVRPLTVTHGSSPQGSRFTVETSAGRWQAESLIFATGGLSIPKLGATGFGYDLARQFGHRVIEPRPALVPLLLAPSDAANWCDLTGLSAEVTITTSPYAQAPSPSLEARKPRPSPRPSFREKLLITHRGLSGPAALQVSSYWRPGAALQVDLAPDRSLFDPMLASSARRDRASLIAALRSLLPARFADRWADLQLRQGEDWTNARLTQLEHALHTWTLHPAGTEGFSKAEVTAGGVDTRELDARTLQSHRLPGLFFIGEVVDVTGWLGGYNFQWAWSSATAAGQTA